MYIFVRTGVSAKFVSFECCGPVLVLTIVFPDRSKLIFNNLSVILQPGIA